MEKYKTGVSDLDLLKHQITNSDPSEVDAILEHRPQESIEKVIDTDVEHTFVNNPTPIINELGDQVRVADLETLKREDQQKADMAKEEAMPNEDESPFAINTILNQTVLVVDNFYKNPDRVRNFALEQEFIENNDFYRGKRTQSFRLPHQQHVFGLLLGAAVANWEEYSVNGCYQLQDAEDLEVIHMDQQQYGGIIYLNPNAPANCGTSLYRSRLTGIMSKNDLKDKPKVEQDDIFNRTFEYGFFDKSKFDEIDRIGNVYNRLILFNGKNIHAVTNTFGNNKDNSRLFQLFFFDLEDPK